MPRRIVKIGDFQNNVAGQTAIIDVPTGLKFHRFYIRHTDTAADANEATMTANFDEIRLEIDGEVTWRLTGGQLIALNKYYGKPITTGSLAMYMSRPWARTAQGEDALGLGTADVETIRLEVDLNAGATNPTLELYALQEATNEPLGAFLKVLPFTYSTTVVGEFQIKDLPRGAWSAFAAHLTSANFTKVEVEANDRKVYEADTVMATAEAVEAGRTWQAGYTHIDFTDTNRVADALPMDLKSLLFKLTANNPGSFRLLLERVDNRKVTARQAA